MRLNHLHPLSEGWLLTSALARRPSFHRSPAATPTPEAESEAHWYKAAAWRVLGATHHVHPMFQDVSGRLIPLRAEQEQRVLQVLGDAPSPSGDHDTQPTPPATADCRQRVLGPN